jgi:stearoyl-CoA desaturase (delta-9 desaturase)
MKSLYAGIIFIGLGRAIQHHMTFCINSWSHIFGTENYSLTTAKDSSFLSPLLLGENYHNFHHAFPQDYRNGHKWYHFDAHKWIIYIFYLTGLAYDLNITSSNRISAKQKIVSNKKEKNALEEWSNMEFKIHHLSIKANEIIVTMHDSHNKISKNINDNMTTLFLNPH